MIHAIPTATADQWNSMFTTNRSTAPAPIDNLQQIAGQHYPAPPGQPEPFPGYS